MAEFGRLGKGRRIPDKPLQAQRCPAQTRYDGRRFEAYPQGKALGVTITYLRWTCGLPYKKYSPV
jgi:hypothetical protein